MDGDASMFHFVLGVRFGDPDLLARLLGRLRASLGARVGRAPTRPRAERL